MDVAIRRVVRMINHMQVNIESPLYDMHSTTIHILYRTISHALEVIPNTKYQRNTKIPTHTIVILSYMYIILLCIGIPSTSN